jgi:hypothetical protein
MYKIMTEKIETDLQTEYRIHAHKYKSTNEYRTRDQYEIGEANQTFQISYGTKYLKRLRRPAWTYGYS